MSIVVFHDFGEGLDCTAAGYDGMIIPSFSQARMFIVDVILEVEPGGIGRFPLSRAHSSTH